MSLMPGSETSSVEPLERILVGVDSAVRLATVGLFLLLGMQTVQLGGLTAGDEGAEVDVRGAGVGHGGDAHLAEEVDAVRGDGGAHGDEVLGAETGELVVLEMVLRGRVSSAGEDEGWV